MLRLTIASLLIIGGGSFSSDFEPFQGLQIEFPVAVWGRGNFEIIMINGMTLWSKLESAW